MFDLLCFIQLPVACKSCPCGHVFISRKLHQAQVKKEGILISAFKFFLKVSRLLCKVWMKFNTLTYYINKVRTSRLKYGQLSTMLWKNCFSLGKKCKRFINCIQKNTQDQKSLIQNFQRGIVSFFWELFGIISITYPKFLFLLQGTV